MRSLCVGPATQLRLPDHRIFAAGDSRTRCEEIRAPRAGPTCTLVCKARQDSGDRAGAADRRELSQQKPSLRRFAWQKEPQRQFCWCDLCAGDGLLLCNKCEGRKYVNTEPGQAGVQFFGGTARCSICQGVATPTPHVGSRGPCHARFVLATRTARGGVS